MLALKKFEGDSSRDAPGFGDDTNYRVWGSWGILYDIFKSLTKGADLQRRRKQVARLKVEILPKFPNSMICPQCLSVLHRA